MPRPGLKSALACASLTLAVLTAAPTTPGQAAAPPPQAPRVAGELIVGYSDGRSRVIEVPRGSLARARAAYERSPGVEYAVPNHIATAAALTPLDLGTTGTPSGWMSDQWSLLAKPGGIRARQAWERLASAGRPGGKGVTIAIVDSGIAYAPTAEGGSAAPDFDADQFVRGVDLVDDDDRPLDENGHGTHVAATIGEEVTLGRPAEFNDYLTGIAYGAKLMPVRVLDGQGEGPASDVGAGILWAAKHGADVINLSLQFDDAITSCAQIPTVCAATKRAARRGAVVVAAGGNALEGEGRPGALYPAAAPRTLAVGATTEHGCIAEYSHYGKGITLTAPGGGGPRAGSVRPECATDARPILALTLECFPGVCGLGLYGEFAIRADTGTSMAAAHTSAVAALVIAAGTAGKDPTPKQVARRLRCTAFSSAPRRLYGAGRLDALRAVQPKYRC